MPEEPPSILPRGTGTRRPLSPSPALPGSAVYIQSVAGFSCMAAQRDRHRRHFGRPVAGLDQRHSARRVFGEAGGDHRAGGAAADDDEIEVLRHSTPPGSTRADRCVRLACDAKAVYSSPDNSGRIQAQAQPKGFSNRRRQPSRNTVCIMLRPDWLKPLIHNTTLL